MSEFGEYLDWLKDEAAKQELLEERETEQAETFADLRRGGLADRTGFAGLVNVGDAARRTDATVAAQVAGLDADDPARQVYEDALASEREDRSKQTRVISGEQYRAEDALAALQERLEDDATVSDLETIRTDFEEFGKEFDFFDDDDFAADIEAAFAEIEEAERLRREREEVLRRQREADHGGELGEGDDG